MSRDGLEIVSDAAQHLARVHRPGGPPARAATRPDQADRPHPAWVARPAGPSRQSAAEAMLWAPVIGLVLGAIAAAVLYVFGQLLHTGSLVAAVLAVGSLAVLSRGLHLDGLADLADGLGSLRPPAGALEVMRRSDIGPFGVVTLVLTLLIQVAGLPRPTRPGAGVPAIIVAAVTGRAGHHVGLPPRRAAGAAGRAGRDGGRQRGPGRRGRGDRAVLAVTVGGIFLAAAVADVPVQWILPVAVGAGLVTGIALGEHGARRLGGVTGDVLGAVSEAATAACLLVTAIS